MSSAKPFPQKNHTQLSRQPTCNIITGRLSPFNSPQSPQLSPFNSPQSPKPAAPYPASCSSRLSAIVTALCLAAATGLQWYAVSHFSPLPSSHLSAIVTALCLAATTGLQWNAVSHFSPFPWTPSCPPPSSLPSPSPIALLPLLRPSPCSPAYISSPSTATVPIIAAAATLLPIPSTTPTACDAIWALETSDSTFKATCS